MQPAYSLQLAVEAPACGLRVILVAGALDSASSARLAPLIDVQAQALAAALDGLRTGHVVIDLANVRSFGVGGLEVLLAAREAGGRAGVALHLAGLGARELLLPQRVMGLLADFSRFATLEDALRHLQEPDLMAPESGGGLPSRQPASSSTSRSATDR